MTADMLTETSNKTGIVDTVETEVKRGWFEKLDVEGHNLKMKIDTGASCNVMSVETYKALCNDKFKKAKTKFESYGGHKLEIAGKWCCVASFDDKLYPLDFIIVREDAITLLGLPSCVSLGIVQEASEVHETSEHIREQYADIFKGIGLLPGEHKIRLKEDVKPVVYSARKVPHRLRDELKAELDKMEADGIIQPVTKPTEWVSPLVLVLKPGGQIRVCMDPGTLNEAIQREHFAIPTAEEISACLHGSKYFTTLDATSGFLQLKLDEESSYTMTFASPFGRYRYLRLPFGIKSAPEVFHRTVAELFSDIEGVETYVDDFLIHGATEEEHDARLKLVLDRCRSINLHLRASASLNKQNSHILVTSFRTVH